MISNNGLRPYLLDPFQLQHLKFAFVRSRRGSKKKVIERISAKIFMQIFLFSHYCTWCGIREEVTLMRGTFGMPREAGPSRFSVVVMSRTKGQLFRYRFLEQKSNVLVSFLNLSY
jgi:hypothetical protein